MGACFEYLRLFGFCDQNLFERQIAKDKKIKFSPKGPTQKSFSQGTDASKNLTYETLYIGNYEYVNISSFPVLEIKLWLEEDGDFNRNDHLYSFKFIQSKAQN